nr:DDRGK domain-containing protein 1 [Ipomoea batatas]
MNMKKKLRNTCIYASALILGMLFIPQPPRWLLWQLGILSMFLILALIPLYLWKCRHRSSGFPNEHEEETKCYTYGTQEVLVLVLQYSKRATVTTKNYSAKSDSMRGNDARQGEAWTCRNSVECYLCSGDGEAKEWKRKDGNGGGR